MSNLTLQEHAESRHQPGLLAIAQAEFLYKHYKTTLISSLVAALTVIPAFYLVADHQLMYGWIGIFILISLGRYWLARYYEHRLHEVTTAQRAITLFMLGTLVSGIAWGFSGLIFISFASLTSESQLLYVGLYVMYCCALAAGCLASYAVNRLVWYAFAIPCMFPLLVVLASAGDLVFAVIALLMLVYFAFISRNMVNIHDTIMESIVLRFDKQDLSDYLQQEQSRVYELNNKLKQDIEKRKQTEEELRQAYAESEKLAAELLALSSQDSLTGIPNRRSFDNFLQNEWNRAIRQHRCISLIMGDIDYYKSYNDILGHQAGDECLIQIANVLEDFSRRGGEMAARYGGEEFAIVLADSKLDKATELAEQIRQAILDLRLANPGSKISEYLSMSFGVSAAWPNVNTKQTELIQVADAALYEAKSNGRNCVVSKTVTSAGQVREQDMIYETLAEVNGRYIHLVHNNESATSIFVERWDNDELMLNEHNMRTMLESYGYNCQRHDYLPGMTFTEHRHACNKIDAVLSGCLRIKTATEQFDLHSGDYAFIPAGLLHSAEVVGDQPVVSIDAEKPVPDNS